MTWVRVRGAWLAVSSVVAVGLQDSTSAGEGGERKRERGKSERERGRGGRVRERGWREKEGEGWNRALERDGGRK